MRFEEEAALFRDIEQIGDALRDPCIGEAIGYAKEIDLEIRSGSVGTGDAADVLRILDGEMWGTFLDKTAKVTASIQPVLMASPDHAGYVWRNDPLYGAKFEEAEGLISKGFCITDDGYGARAVNMLFARTQTDEFDQPRVQYCSVPLDSLVEFDDIMSERHIRALLDMYVPRIIEEIDERVLGHADNRGQALLALRGLSLVDLDTVSVEGGLRERVASALCLYVELVTSLDSAMPYVLSYSGALGVDTSTGVTAGDMTCVDAAATLRHVCTIAVVSSIDAGLRSAKLGIRSAVHVSSSLESDFTAVLIIDNLDACSSIRDGLYPD